MPWTPGLPVLTDADRRDHAEWWRLRKLEAQRERRQRYPRIDYYPCPEALEAVQELIDPWTSATAALDRIVTEWAEWRAAGGELPE